MKIQVNGAKLFELNETQQKVIMNEVPADIFQEDMKRRLKYILMHKYEQCFKDLKEEWDPKLVSAGIEMVPSDPDKYAELVFSQPNYMDRKARDEYLPPRPEVENPFKDEPWLAFTGAARRGELV